MASGDLVVNGRLTIPAGELSWQFSRSGGPGGQNVNTTDSRVALSWDAGRSRVLSPLYRGRVESRLQDRLLDGVLTVVASEHRSQLRNRDAARDRLAAAVRAAVAPPPKPRRPTKPSKGSQRRRLDAKRRRGDLKRTRRTDDDS